MKIFAAVACMFGFGLFLMPYITFPIVEAVAPSLLELPFGLGNYIVVVIGVLISFIVGSLIFKY